jgi:hypothetical protein
MKKKIQLYTEFLKAKDQLEQNVKEKLLTLKRIFSKAQSTANIACAGLGNIRIVQDVLYIRKNMNGKNNNSNNSNNNNFK